MRFSPRRILLTGVAACLSLSLTTAAQAGLLGSNFDVEYRYPDASTGYGAATYTPDNFTVGAGVESDVLIEGVTNLKIDFSNSVLTILLNTTLRSPTWNAVDFNGLVFSLQTPGSLNGLAGTVDTSLTTMAGFNDSRVTVTPSLIAINWSGLSYVDGTKVVVNFASTDSNAVPEPGSALVFAGLAIVLAGSRFRRLKAPSRSR